MYSATNLRTWYATTSDFPVVFIADASMDTLNLARDVAHALPSTVLCTSTASLKHCVSLHTRFRDYEN